MLNLEPVELSLLWFSHSQTYQSPYLFTDPITGIWLFRDGDSLWKPVKSVITLDFVSDSGIEITDLDVKYEIRRRLSDKMNFKLFLSVFCKEFRGPG